MNKKKVLITGSCGFIFGNFIRKAIYEKLPYNFVSIDRVSNGALNNIYWNKNHNFYIGDINDQHFIDVVFQFERPDIVIHGAEESLNEESIINTNVNGTQKIINSCIKHNVEKLIYVSTDKVYGELVDDKKSSWEENNVINPNNLFAASKASGELLVTTANKNNGLNYNILRLSNNYGPRQNVNKFIPNIIKNILNDEKINIYDKGLNIRDWTHIFDTCAAISKILDSGKTNETYNISSNHEFSNLELVQKICNIMKKGHDLISFIPSTSRQDFRRALNNEKLKSLGWESQIKFKDGLEQTIEWYQMNQWFIK